MFASLFKFIIIFKAHIELLEFLKDMLTDKYSNNEIDLLGLVNLFLNLYYIIKNETCQYIYFSMFINIRT